MADTEALLGGLVRPDGCDWLCIVGNARGIERAAATPGVTTVGYPLSVNETFQRRNLGRDLARTWTELPTLLRRADEAGLSLVAYVSMGFGNPYDEPWGPQDTAEVVARVRGLGVTRVALADTVGRADAGTVRAVLGAVRAPQALGLHLHARRDAWRGLVDAGLEAGVRWFEGAFGGVGGCPFAGDALVGNLPSERVLPYLAARGFEPGVDQTALAELATEASALAAEGARSPGG
jgi:hydroxymethylglutaryl-CoA lyase